MNITPITSVQWKSVLTNSIFAFVSTFVVTLPLGGALDKKTVLAAAVAGGMAVQKVVQKALSEE